MNTKILRPVMLAGTLTLLAGCSFTGLDAKDKFSCAAPEGVMCDSMAGVYSKLNQKALPGQNVNSGAGGQGQATGGTQGQQLSRAKVDGEGQGVLTKPIFSGMPIRSAPKILRVWLAPWEDTDGDLHDQSYIYLPVDSGRWQIEHNRRRIMDNYRPIKPPATAPSAGLTEKAPANRQSAIGPGMERTADELEEIQSRQQGLTPEQAAAMFGNIQRPSN